MSASPQNARQAFRERLALGVRSERLVDRLCVMDDLSQIPLIEGLAAHRTDIEMFRFVCGFAVVPSACDACHDCSVLDNSNHLRNSSGSSGAKTILPFCARLILRTASGLYLGFDLSRCALSECPPQTQPFLL